MFVIIMSIWTMYCLLSYIGGMPNTDASQTAEVLEVLTGLSKEASNKIAVATFTTYWLDLWFKPMVVFGIIALINKPYNKTK